MLIPPEPPRLYVSHDAEFRWLIAVEYGRVGEDQPQGCWVPLSDTFAYLLDAPEGRVVGFRVNEFDTFDPDDPEVAAIWDAPRFDVPTLGLMNATAGEVAIAARTRYGDTDSLNRKIFGVALAHQGEEALVNWQHCLESGDGMAHYSLGYTLLELGRAQEAYGHLRHYTEIAPMGPWNWCWYGQAAEAVGELTEARRAYRRAIELDEDDEAGAGIDAARRLEGLPEVLGASVPGVARLSDASLMAQETAGVVGDSGPGGTGRDIDDDAGVNTIGDHDGNADDADARADDDEDADDTDEVPFMSYDGQDFPEHGVRQLNGMSVHLAAGITAGAQPKAYAHTDPNEDAVRVLRSGGATVIVLCDGHRGESSARLAARLLADILEEDPHALDTEEDLLGTLRVANDHVRNETAAAGQPDSRTTLVLAVVEGGRVRWVHMGDSLLAIVEPDGEVRRLGKARHRFLGWPMDLAGVDAATDRGTEHLAPGGWLVLASDGLTDFAKPWRAAVQAATQIDDVATLPLDHPDRTHERPFAIEVVANLIDTTDAGRAGDNVAVVVLGRAPLLATTDDAAAAGEDLGEPTLQDRIRGCMLGTAVGDVLGAGIEHESIDRIRRRFGPEGLTDPAPAYGRAGAITDDTQMALFTAEGLLRTVTGDSERGIPGDPIWQIDLAYARWLRTQGERGHRWTTEARFSSTVVDLFADGDARRGPGRTCIAAMQAAVAGTVDAPTNTSKGCGTVARSAPIGLLCDEPAFAVDVATRAAVLTHGHPTARFAAAAFAALIAHLRRGNGMQYAIHHVVGDLVGDPAADEVRQALLSAYELSGKDGAPTPERIQTLGEGRVADEALAIGFYCALVARDFEHGVLLAVNHGGDSDSTGAVCGALLGTLHGARAIPPRWLEGLELGRSITEIADDVHEAMAREVDVDIYGERWQARWPAE